MFDDPIAPPPTFGRRQRPGTEKPAGQSQPTTFLPQKSQGRQPATFLPPRPAQMRRQPAATGPKPLVAHYTWKMCLLGGSLMATGGKMSSVGFVMFGDLDILEIVSRMVRGTAGDGSMFVMAGLAMCLIGLAWFIQGYRRGQALRIDAFGVSGYTLLGSKRIAWNDIKRIELQWHHSYKRLITFHGVLGAKTVGYGVTGIPVSLGRIDTSEQAVLAAIEAFGPDVPVVNLGGEPGILFNLLQWYARAIEKIVVR
ncbi:MAG: hypothetical protein ACKVP7_19055 [Hyphomicrobiaceae bacterium]